MIRQIARIVAIAALVLTTATGGIHGLRRIFATSGAQRYHQLEAVFPTSLEQLGGRAAEPLLEARRAISIPYALQLPENEPAPVFAARRAISMSHTLQWTDA